MFWASCGSQGWGVGGIGWGMVGGAPHIHVHARMHIHTHIHVKHDNFNCKWQPLLGNPWEFPMMSYVCVHVCACMCTCVGSTLSPSPPQSTHPHPRGDPQNQSKFNSTWTNRDISILFEDLKSVETSLPMGGCIIWWVGWVGWWLGSGQITKNLKIVTESR